MTEANCMLIEMKATTTRVRKQIELLIAELEAVGIDHRNEGGDRWTTRSGRTSG